MRPQGSSPWIAHSQTTMPATEAGLQSSFIVNPPLDSCGVAGEVTSLPYRVPSGKVLVIDRMHLEAVWGSALIVMIGEYVPNSYGGIPGKCMPTLATSTAADPGNWLSVAPSVEWTELDWEFPEGTEINVRLSSVINGPNVVVGWEVSGWLQDAI